MKLILISLALCASSAFAQSNYQNIPQGATSPGVQTTTHAVGQIISVGQPVYENVRGVPICQQVQIQGSQNNFNPGTVTGALIGGALGSQVGKGHGRDVAIATGAVMGAFAGNDNQQQYQPQYQPQYQQQCHETFEQRIVGYRYVAQYGFVQLQGVSREQPRIGQEVSLLVRSTVYIGN